MKRLPSLRSILWADEIALLTAVLPVVAVIMGVLAAAGVLPDLRASSRLGGLALVAREDAPLFYGIAAAGLGFGLTVIGWRVRKIRAAFTLGLEVPGRITKITAFKDRAYLHYAYEVRSKAVTTRHFVHQTKAMKALVEGQQVTIAVSPRSPNDGFVAELFDVT